MKIYLCNLSGNSISDVRYQSAIGSTTYVNATIESIDNGNALCFDIPTSIVKQATASNPLIIKVGLGYDTVNARVAYSNTYWNDEIDVAALLNSPLTVIYINDMASQVVKFKDLRKILNANANAVVATVESAFGE
jgi:hypothetical protein